MTKLHGIQLNVHEAKTHLSRYLTKVEAGQIVTLCRNGVPVAKIVPISPAERAPIRPLGLGKGMGRVTEAFFEPLTEEDLPGMGL